jgi:hypothetical protein
MKKHIQFILFFVLIILTLYSCVALQGQKPPTGNDWYWKNDTLLIKEK